VVYVCAIPFRITLLVGNDHCLRNSESFTLLVSSFQPVLRSFGLGLALAATDVYIDGYSLQFCTPLRLSARDGNACCLHAACTSTSATLSGSASVKDAGNSQPDARGVKKLDAVAIICSIRFRDVFGIPFLFSPPRYALLDIERFGDENRARRSLGLAECAPHSVCIGDAVDHGVLLSDAVYRGHNIGHW
jgi:hypothetical protein